MPGGLLNVVGSGNQNVLLTGTPEKTFWRSTYRRYTNFGLQNFRLDFDGKRQINLTTPTVYNFKVKRYAELVKDMFFVIQLPDIYSPIYPPQVGVVTSEWVPYEFRWIKNLGAMMIQSVRFTIGGTLIQQMSGYDLVALANRDYDVAQKAKWDQQVGNVPELYDPANAFGRINAYPNATYYPGGAEPSIRGRQLRVPIPIFWALNSQQAFPLVCLQYNELFVEVTLRPLRELFQIRDVTNVAGGYPLQAPNFNLVEHQFYRFLQTPPKPDLQPLYSESSATSWNEGTHLSCTYCFLSDDEAKGFALRHQSYLFKELHDSWFYKVSIADKAWLQNSTGLVAAWMILFQRSDVNARNEWSNFTNWSYDHLPYNVTLLPASIDNSPLPGTYKFPGCSDIVGLGYGVNPSGVQTGLYGAGELQTVNQRDILLRMGISLDGTVREEERPAELFRLDQTYLASPGANALAGMHCYNFCLNTSPFVMQPSGAMNLARYSKVELIFGTITPPVSADATFSVICDAEAGGVIGVNKPVFNLYDYAFNLLVIEERYNELIFSGGNAALRYAR